jgi:ATP synthase protein I
MSEGKPPDKLDDFDARLRRAREGQRPSEPEDGGMRKASMSGVGMAFRVGTELVAALIVGVGAGYLLDQWLGTTPWMLIVFFFLGSAAGVLNVYRAASGIGLAPGYKGPEKDEDRNRKDGV